MRRRGLTIVISALATTCALPLAADAATRTAKGKTSQGLAASVRVRGDNSVSRVTVRYVAKCRKRGRSIRGGLFWRDSPGRGFERNGTAFSDGGRTTARSGGYRLLIDSTMSGAPSGSGWAGKFKIKVTVKNRRGRTSDVCRTRSRSWRVGAPAS